MKNQHKETLSALMDNEIDDLEWRRLQGVSSDEICAIWHRYNRVSESIRGARSLSVDVSASVSAAIAKLDDVSFADPCGDSFEPEQNAAGKASSKSAWLTIAIAASFAFAGMMLFEILQTHQPFAQLESYAYSSEPSATESRLGAAAANKLELLLQKAPASSMALVQNDSQVALQAFSQRPDLLENAKLASQRDQLNEYFLQHAGNGFLGVSQGVAPYARLASLSAGNRLVTSQ